MTNIDRRPLAGMRIVDFTHVMAGPFATNYLSQMGADVIKIEPPHGDVFRRYNVDDGAGAHLAAQSMGAPFVGANSGKRSVVLDLKDDADLAVARDLIAGADVVVENFRPGSMDRLGLGYEHAKAMKEDIIYCSVSGYGQSGPMRDFPAIDNVVQAISGMMTVSGTADSEPMRFGVPAVDTFVGTTAALAIISALVQRDRFGTGQRIDVSMLDAALVLLYGAATPVLVSGGSAPRQGNTGYSGSPGSDTFECADGRYVAVGAVQDNQYERLLGVLQVTDLTFDMYISRDALGLEPQEIKRRIAEALKTRPAAEWEPLLSGAGVPCALVRDVAEALSLEQLADRGLLQEAGLDELGVPDARVLSLGFRYAADGPRVTARAPRLGEHTDQVKEEVRSARGSRTD